MAAALITGASTGDRPRAWRGFSRPTASTCSWCRASVASPSSPHWPRSCGHATACASTRSRWTSRSRARVPSSWPVSTQSVSTSSTCVNNAGVGILGLKVQDSDPDAVSRMVQLNVVTTTDLTLLYAGRMVKAGRGAILNVGSIAAYVIPHGLEAGYAASKAYVRSFSECVADDLRGTGVTCTHLAPGPTRTQFMSTRRSGRHVAPRQVFHGRCTRRRGGLRRDAGRAGQRDPPVWAPR